MQFKKEKFDKRNKDCDLKVNFVNKGRKVTKILNKDDFCKNGRKEANFGGREIERTKGKTI